MRIVLSTALIAMCAAACSGCREDQVDAAARDVGAEGSDVAPADAAAEASSDAGGLLDGVSGDGSDSPLSRGTWAGLSVYPDCPPSVAIDPAVAISPLRWKPCPSGRSGCRELVVDWTSRTDIGPIIRRSYPGVKVVGSKAYFSHARYSREWMTDVIQEGFDGPAVFATAFGPYAQPLHCALTASIGRAGVAILGAVGGKDRPIALDKMSIVGAATLAEPTRPTLRLMDKTEIGAITESGGPVGIVAAERKAFVSSYLPTSVQPFDLSTLKVSRSENPSSQPIVVPDGVLTNDLSSFGLLLIRDDASFVAWMKPDPWPGVARAILSYDFDQISRDSVAWVECTNDDSVGDPVLWTAGYTADPTKVIRRKVGKLPTSTPRCGHGLVVSNGFALIPVARDVAAVYRLADGTGWSFGAEAGHEFSEPLWLDDTEAVVLTVRPGEKPSGILRMRRDGLGDPKLKLVP